jgi:hypothetical protein
MNTPEHRVVIIYDSTDNSVFESQLLQPLLQWRAAAPHRTATIISCEQQPNNRPSQRAGIKCIYIKRIPYIGRMSLWYAALRVYLYVRKLQSYELFARGPFAGYIARTAATSACIQIIIQARGLAAQEYRFTQEQRGNRTLHTRLRIALLHALERTVYGTHNHNITIQAVSSALRAYLIAEFNAPAAQITLAHEDIPQPLDATTRASYRAAVRTELNIAQDIRLYCYNGSYKPWQCPSQTLEFFKNELNNDPTAHLLILSGDRDVFMQACRQFCLPVHTYTVISVQSYDVIRHLAACDFGMLFRQQDVINFTSRPTKALEYYAAGCITLHNGTVDALNCLPEQARLYRTLPGA